MSLTEIIISWTLAGTTIAILIGGVAFIYSRRGKKSVNSTPLSNAVPFDVGYTPLKNNYGIIQDDSNTYHLIIRIDSVKNSAQTTSQQIDLLNLRENIFHNVIVNDSKFNKITFDLIIHNHRDASHPPPIIKNNIFANKIQNLHYTHCLSSGVYNLTSYLILGIVGHTQATDLLIECGEKIYQHFQRETDINILSLEEAIIFWRKIFSPAYKSAPLPAYATKNNGVKISRLTCTQDIKIDESNKNILIFDHSDEKLKSYLSCLVIQNFPSDNGGRSYVSDAILTSALNQRCELLIHIPFKCFSSQRYQFEYGNKWPDKDKNKKLYGRYSVIENEIATVKEKIQEGGAWINFSLSIFVRDGNLKNLQAQLNIVKEKLTKHNFYTVDAGNYVEPRFFKMVPHAPYLGKHQQSAKFVENIVSSSRFFRHFFILDTQFKGYKSSPLGPGEVTVFPTISGGSVFNLTFHKETKINVLSAANVFVVGTQGTGKTVLLETMLTSLMRFNVKILSFDSYQGRKISTRFLNGRYLSFDGKNKNQAGFINPFLIFHPSLKVKPQIKEACKGFLSDIFLPAMLSLEEFKNQREIDYASDVITKMLDQMDKSNDVSLSIDFEKYVDDFFQKPEYPQLERNIKRWCKKYNGIYSSYIGGNDDMFDFRDSSHILSVVDIQFIINDPILMGVFIPYIFFQFEQLGLYSDSFLINSIDETAAFLEIPAIHKYIKKYMVQGRKLKMVNFMAFQFPEQMGDMATDIVSQSSCQIYFPNSSIKENPATIHTYKNLLSFSSDEIDFIKGNFYCPPSARPVLIKHIGHLKTASSIIDFDLSHLGKLIHIFDSGGISMKAFEEALQEENLVNEGNNLLTDEQLMNLYQKYIENLTSIHRTREGK